MSKKSQTVSVTILNKQYKISCAPEEQQALIRNAHLLDITMQQLHDSGKVTGVDRIAVMAALNLANEREHSAPTSVSSNENPEITQHIINLRQKIENALENF